MRFRPCEWCDPGWIRTNGRQLRRLLLYPAELRGLAPKMRMKEGQRCAGLHHSSGRPDSNWRPSAPKADALPDCATLRILKMLCVSSGAHNIDAPYIRQRKIIKNSIQKKSVLSFRHNYYGFKLVHIVLFLIPATTYCTIHTNYNNTVSYNNWPNHLWALHLKFCY